MADDLKQESLCGSCGKPIPRWAPAGNCPACLFGSGKNKEKAKAHAVIAPEQEARERIGDWELQERIGEGAFGVVFAAEQTEPVRRSAALKILRPGMGSKELLARFQAESQALALMNHPDIVTIFDAGNTEDGRPFFAMEFVPGDAVTRFASGFSLDEKLALFDRICAVVEHAHSRGIIHRDLKPGNILAYRNEDGEAVIKLLDFGIAKATDHILTEATILTGDGNFLGTPEYMSPEQTTESDIDIRADVYSLGVILFELLAGRTPFVLGSNSLDAVLRFLKKVRDEDPPTLSSIASEPLRSDLEWIVGKAIEKNRDRRYRTVAELRDDLRRYRNDEPVRARPPDTFYIARKFLRRNWKFAATVAAILFSVAVAAVVSGVMAVKAREAARETSSAFSMSDLRSAVNSLDRREFSKAIAHLTQSLRTDPNNAEATMLLHSTLKQYPMSRTVLEKVLEGKSLRVASFIDEEGNSVIVSEKGNLQFLDPSGEERAPGLITSGTNLFSAVSPDRRLFVVTNIQEDFLLMNLETFQRLPLEQVSVDVGERFSEIVFSRDGALLCMGSSAGQIHLWDTESGKLRWSRKHEAGLYTLVFAAEEKRVVVAGRDGNVVELDSGSGLPVKVFPGEPERFRDLVDSGSGFRYYAVTASGAPAAVDAGRDPKTFTETRVEMPLLLSAADPGRRLSAYAGKSEVSIWTVEGITIIKQLSLPDPPTFIEIHPKKDIAYIGTKDSGVHLWDFGNDRILGTEITRARNVEAMQVDVGQNLLRTITRDGVFRIVQLPDEVEKEVRSVVVPKGWETIPIESRNDHYVRAGNIEIRSLENVPENPPRAISLSADKSKVICVFREGFVRLWDRETGKLEAEIETETKSVRCCDLSPDGRRIAYRERFSAFAFYDIETGSTSRYSSRHQRDLSSIVFSPDGNLFAVATDGGGIDVYSVGTGKEVIERVHHDVRGLVVPHYCRFSNNSEMLATWGEADRSFRFWNTKTGVQEGSPIVANGIPKFGCFLEGDEIFAAVSEEGDDYYLRLWSLSKWVPVTPRRKVRIEELSEADFRKPDSRFFSLEQLHEVDQQNGLKIGKYGVTGISMDEGSAD